MTRYSDRRDILTAALADMSIPAITMESPKNEGVLGMLLSGLAQDAVLFEATLPFILKREGQWLICFRTDRTATQFVRLNGFGYKNVKPGEGIYVQSGPVTGVFYLNILANGHSKYEAIENARQKMGDWLRDHL